MKVSELVSQLSAIPQDNVVTVSVSATDDNPRMGDIEDVSGVITKGLLTAVTAHVPSNYVDGRDIKALRAAIKSIQESEWKYLLLSSLQERSSFRKD